MFQKSILLTLYLQPTRRTARRDGSESTACLFATAPAEAGAMLMAVVPRQEHVLEASLARGASTVSAVFVHKCRHVVECRFVIFLKLPRQLGDWVYDDLTVS